METSKKLNTISTPTNIAEEDNSPRHAMEYQQFVEWIALPIKEREPKTQKELAGQFGLSEWSLSQWKLREGFWGQVEAIRKNWGRNNTPEVLNGLLEKAKSGDASAARLWLEYVEGHTPRSRSDITNINANVGVKDLLDQLQDDPDTTWKPNPENNSARPGMMERLMVGVD